MGSLSQEARAILARLKIRPEKRRGQNFMVNADTLRFLADALAPEAGETVVEIGPGLGFLTACLLEKGARVIAIEKDFVLSQHLKETYRTGTLKLIEEDVLKTDLKRDASIDRPVKIIGNIPYNITSPILEWLIAQRPLVSRVVLTVQLEVAQRLTARPGGKEWGALSIFVQYHAKIKLLKKIDRSHFSPAPNVDSAAIELDFSTPPFSVGDEEALFFSLVRRAFQKRRKTLLNALSDETEFPKDRLSAAFDRAQIDPQRRPETLFIPDWLRLANALKNS